MHSKLSNGKTVITTPSTPYEPYTLFAYLPRFFARRLGVAAAASAAGSIAKVNESSASTNWTSIATQLERYARPAVSTTW